jgi:hypothetical protein
MPNINVRLTDEQHAELERAARRSLRSIQKEIIWRLFRDEVAIRSPERILVEADAQPRDVAARTIDGLSERGGAGPDPGAVMETDDRHDTDGGRAAPAPRSLDVPRSDSPVDPRWCGMANRHRSRSKSNPCPRCGYPTERTHP